MVGHFLAFLHEVCVVLVYVYLFFFLLCFLFFLASLVLCFHNKGSEQALDGCARPLPASLPPSFRFVLDEWKVCNVGYVRLGYPATYRTPGYGQNK